MKILLAVDGSPMSTRAGGARSFHLQRTRMDYPVHRAQVTQAPTVCGGCSG